MRQLRDRGKALGVVPVGEGRTAEAWRLGSKAARGAAQRAVASGGSSSSSSSSRSTRLGGECCCPGAEAVAGLRRQGLSVSARGRVRKLAPSDGWQTTAAAVARRVVEVEDEQVDAGLAGSGRVVLKTHKLNILQVLFTRSPYGRPSFNMCRLTRAYYSTRPYINRRCEQDPPPALHAGNRSNCVWPVCARTGARSSI
jgi:hypothetical protein